MQRSVTTLSLSLASGATDALSFLALGGVFSSVITGNLILLGVSVGRQDAELALHAGVAFLGYGVGAFVGARLALGEHRSGRLRGLLDAMVELLLLLGVVIGWELASGHPSGAGQLTVLSLAAAAMGVQSARVRRLPAAETPTTYLTGTMTAVLERVAEGVGLGRQWRGVASLAAMLAGAALSGGLVHIWRPGAPVVAPVALAVALAGQFVER